MKKILSSSRSLKGLIGRRSSILWLGWASAWGCSGAKYVECPELDAGEACMRFHVEAEPGDTVSDLHRDLIDKYLYLYIVRPRVESADECWIYDGLMLIDGDLDWSTSVTLPAGQVCVYVSMVESEAGTTVACSTSVGPIYIEAGDTESMTLVVECSSYPTPDTAD